MSKRPTLSEVAKLANVSMATVSLVINNNSGGIIAISEDTRQRVLAAVDELGYVPNLAARSLRTSHTHLLAVMVHDLTNPFFAYLVRGAQLIAETQGYEILVFDCIYDFEREKTFIKSVLQHRVEGAMMVVYQAQPETLAPLLRANIPVITIGSEWPNVDSVNVIDSKAISNLVAYLVSKGHRRIAHLAGQQTIPASINRLEGYRVGLSEAGIAYDESLVCYGNFNRVGIEERLAPLFRNERSFKPPTALVAVNDMMAIEAIQTLKRWGYSIPGDVAVTGYDDIPEAKLIVPSLTTINNVPEFMGGKAVHLLLQRLSTKQPAEAQRVRLDGKLEVRESA